MHVCITSHSEAIKAHYKLAKSKMATHNRAANMPCILSRAFFCVYQAEARYLHKALKECVRECV